MFGGGRELGKKKVSIVSFKSSDEDSEAERARELKRKTSVSRVTAVSGILKNKYPSSLASNLNPNAYNRASSRGGEPRRVSQTRQISETSFISKKKKREDLEAAEKAAELEMKKK